MSEDTLGPALSVLTSVHGQAGGVERAGGGLEGGPVVGQGRPCNSQMSENVLMLLRNHNKAFI